MPLLSAVVFVVAAILAVGIIIGLAFQLTGFLIAGAIILAAAVWISGNLRTQS